MNIEKVINSISYKKDKFKKIIEKVNNANVKSIQTLPSLRGSALPFCGIKYMIDYLKVKNKVDIEDIVDFNTLFYLSFGTYTHEFIQQLLGINGKMYGKWICENDKCKDIHEGKYTSCSKCGSQKKYIEYNIYYKGFSGHIDGIVKIKNKYYVIEFKTTSKQNQKKLTQPYYNHLLQASSYAYVLAKNEKKNEPKMLVDGIIICYINREDIIKRKFETTTFMYKFKDLNPLFDLFETQLDMFWKTKKMISKNKDKRIPLDFKKIRLCNNYIEYGCNFKYGCEYSTICFNETILKDYIDKLKDF